MKRLSRELHGDGATLLLGRVVERYEDIGLGKPTERPVRKFNTCPAIRTAVQDLVAERGTQLLVHRHLTLCIGSCSRRRSSTRRGPMSRKTGTWGNCSTGTSRSGSRRNSRF